MKINTRNLIIASALGFAGLAAVPANAADTLEQALTATYSVTGGVSGNYVVGGDTTQGLLQSISVTGTLTTQGVTSNKTTGTGNKTVTTVTSKAVISKITNQNILDIAGISTKGVTLGLFSEFADVDPIIVAVQKSGKNTILTALDEEVIDYISAEPSVVTSLNEKIGDGKDPEVLVSETISFLEMGSLIIGDTYTVTGLNKVNGTYNSKIGFVYTSSMEGVGTTNFETGEPDIAYDDTNVIIGTQFALSPMTNTNTKFVGAVWSAQGLPTGLSINSTNGQITGKISTGVIDTAWAVDITVKTALGTATADDVILTLAAKVSE